MSYVLNKNLFNATRIWTSQLSLAVSSGRESCWAYLVSEPRDHAFIHSTTTVQFCIVQELNQKRNWLFHGAHHVFDTLLLLYSTVSIALVFRVFVLVAQIPNGLNYCTFVSTTVMYRLQITVQFSNCMSKVKYSTYCMTVWRRGKLNGGRWKELDFDMTILSYSSLFVWVRFDFARGLPCLVKEKLLYCTYWTEQACSTWMYCTTHNRNH